jgi:hypothetical protein
LLRLSAALWFADLLCICRLFVALGEGQDHHLHQQRDVIKTPLGSMEEMIMKRSAAITGTLVVLFAVMSMVGQAQAGASASAPSKNSRSSQLASQQTNHNTAITEYSSSSRHSH